MCHIKDPEQRFSSEDQVSEKKLQGIKSSCRSSLSTMEQCMTLPFIPDAARTHRRFHTIVFVTTPTPSVHWDGRQS